MVQKQTSQPIFLPALLATVIGAVAFGTAAADAAWCGSTIARCAWYVPYAAIGGVLFDLPGAVGSLAIVVVLRILKVRLSAAVLVGIAVVMALLGFALGSAPGIRGQGP